MVDLHNHVALNIQDAALILMDGVEEYEIDRIIKQSADKCLVKWRNGQESWEPIANLKEDIPELLRRFQATQCQKRAEKKEK